MNNYSKEGAGNGLLMCSKKKKKQSCGNHLKERERDVNQKPLSQERN